MHEHLREVAAMRLILRLGQDDLHGADDPRLVLGGQHEALPARDAGGRVAPEGVGLGASHREHEADRRAALDTVDQHVAQPLDLALADGPQMANPDGVRHVHLLGTRERSLAMMTRYRAGLRVRLRNAVGSSSRIARQSSSARRCGTRPIVTSTAPSWSQIGGWMLTSRAPVS